MLERQETGVSSWGRPLTQPQSRAAESAPTHIRWQRLALIPTMAVALLTLFGFWGRHGWLFDLAAHFRPQYAVFLLGMSFLFLLGRQRLLFLLSTLLAIANLLLLLPYYTPNAAAAHETKTVRALSFNVLGRNDDYAALFSLIAETDPDVIVLAEVTESWRAELVRLLPDYPYSNHANAPRYRGTMIYSRIPFTDAGVTLISSRGRPTAVARLKLDGQTVTLIGAHPASPTRPWRQAARQRQLDDIAAFVAVQSEPVLLLGDLNITAWSPYFREFLQETGLRDGRLGFGLQATWPAANPLLRIPIDHALVSSDLSIHNFMTGPNVGSDHLPILIEFSLSS